MRRDVFQAIADPTRRAIIGLLAAQALSVNALAGQFAMSRQAVSLHIKILEECGLVAVRQQGRERYCEARLDQLQAVSDWVSQYQQFWTAQFASLDNYLSTLQKQQKK
ncbi:MAG: winged helix-turn-helix transcriptional regulator [Chitinophagaceae bacterium]|nr:winged helix-turn-helix transcriptional regulator [Chitinophagaceae bacterium]